MQELLRKYSQVFLSRGLLNPSKTYAQRRKALRKKCPGVGVFYGVTQAPGEEHSWYANQDPHVQDPAFLYLTGINQTHCIYAWSARGEFLFVPAQVKEREFWDGVRIALASESQNLRELQKLTGFKNILGILDFRTWCQQELPSKPTPLWFLGPNGETSQQALVTALKTWNIKIPTLQSFANQLTQQRVIMDSTRMQMLERAQARTHSAFVKTLGQLSQLTHEHSVARTLEYHMLSTGHDGLSFPTIAAGGDGAATLHYVKNDEPLEAGRLLLLDFGLREGTLCSDISRTVPINGRFNPLQKLLYQIVLDTQEFHQNQVRPGAKLGVLNGLAWEFLERNLVMRFLSKGGTVHRNYAFRPGTLGPHGISHLIGDLVHDGDTQRSYYQEELKVGQVISNEPGLYGTFSGVFDGVRYTETLGIRIEDDLLITIEGCQNLSASIPKSVLEIESLIK